MPRTREGQAGATRKREDILGRAKMKHAELSAFGQKKLLGRWRPGRTRTLVRLVRETGAAAELYLGVSLSTAPSLWSFSGVPELVQYTLVASTARAIVPGCPETSVVGVPPPRGTFLIAPSSRLAQ